MGSLDTLNACSFINNAPLDELAVKLAGLLLQHLLICIFIYFYLVVSVVQCVEVRKESRWDGDVAIVVSVEKKNFLG